VGVKKKCSKLLNKNEQQAAKRKSILFEGLRGKNDPGLQGVIFFARSCAVVTLNPERMRNPVSAIRIKTLRNIKKLKS